MVAKGPGEAQDYDASALRIGIVHTRWNTPIVSALVDGARKSLTAAGVPASNIVTQSVPGSYELPFAVQRMYGASTSSSASGLVSAATDLLGAAGGASSSSLDDLSTSNVAGGSVTAGRKGEVEVAQNKGPLDAIIAIGVLIKGSTMHFEYIAEATTHGLMRVQLDMGVPVVFGVLTCLTEEQAYTRAGMKEQAAAAAGGQKQTKPDENLSYAEQGHNHGEDWGNAAVEMAVKRRGWGEGRYVA